MVAFELRNLHPCIPMLVLKMFSYLTYDSNMELKFSCPKTTNDMWWLILVPRRLCFLVQKLHLCCYLQLNRYTKESSANTSQKKVLYSHANSQQLNSCLQYMQLYKIAFLLPYIKLQNFSKCTNQNHLIIFHL